MKDILNNEKKNKISLSVDYILDENTTTEELIELAKDAKKYGGLYTMLHQYTYSQWVTNINNLCDYGFFMEKSKKILLECIESF